MTATTYSDGLIEAAANWLAEVDIDRRQTRVLVNRRGVQVETPLTNDEALAFAEAQAGENDFLAELVKKSQRGLGLTAEQWWWAHTHALRLIAAAERAGERASEVVEEEKTYPRIVAMLTTASAHLSFPRISLQSGAHSLTCALSGKKSKWVGWVHLTDGGAYHRSTYYGRIAPDGAAHLYESMPGEVRDILDALEQDPYGTVGAAGKLSGYCCFCRRQLTDRASVEAGYGPDCAEHYGLPYGDKMPWKAEKRRAAPKAQPAPRGPSQVTTAPANGNPARPLPPPPAHKPNPHAAGVIAAMEGGSEAKSYREFIEAANGKRHRPLPPPPVRDRASLPPVDEVNARRIRKGGQS